MAIELRKTRKPWEPENKKLFHRSHNPTSKLLLVSLLESTHIQLPLHNPGPLLGPSGGPSSNQGPEILLHLLLGEGNRKLNSLIPRHHHLLLLLHRRHRTPHVEKPSLLFVLRSLARSSSRPQIPRHHGMVVHATSFFSESSQENGVAVVHFALVGDSNDAVLGRVESRGSAIEVGVDAAK